MSRPSPQAIGPTVQTISTEMGPVQIIQMLDTAFPVRHGPHLTTDQLQVQQGRREVIDFLAEKLGVEEKKEYTRVHRTT